MSSEVLLRVDNLVKHFPIFRGFIQRQVGAVRTLHDLVVDAGARSDRDLRADAETNGLDGVNRHHGLGQTAIQLPVPLDVGAQPDRDAAHNHLERTAQRVASRARGTPVR